jgi:serine/threonine protein kinase
MTATITCTGCKHGYAETALFCPNCGRPKVREATGDSLVGKVLGERFQVLSLLGQGGSGTIYRAEHTTLRRKVAIKVLHNELSRDDLAVERFRREATTVADIDNEHIVEIHDFGRAPDGRLYLAMELLEGETLDAVLAREKQLSVERTADILIQVGEALMEAHAIGYVHRDLRPRNIYLTTRRAKQNFVKLLDFGLAKLVEVEKDAESTSLGMTFGDPRYMSPEQARGDRIDRRADIYQLGCVAYEMLTGGPPFTGTRVFDILTKQVTETPSPLPEKRSGTPLWMEAAIAKMLAKDPENRFATTSRMVEALRRGLETGEVMEDGIARRRESVPPPSVSRVMQKMGISPEREGLPPLVTPASVPEPAAPKVEVSAEVSESRRSMGTPKVGVPVVKAPTDAPGRVQTGMVAAGPTPSRSKRESSGISSTGASRSRASSHDDEDRNLSQVWYDEGDERKPTGTFSDLGDSMYDEPVRGRRWGLIIGVVGALAVIGTVAFALTRGGEKPAAPKTDEVATTPPPATDVAPSQIMTEDAGVAAIPDAGTIVQTPPAGKKNPGTGTPRTNNTNNSVVNSRPNPITTNNNGFMPPGTPAGFDPPGTPSGFTPPGTTTPPPVVNTPPIVNTPPKPPTLTDNPEDPYGPPDEPPPSDSGSTETKAAFFANLGTQQLGSGDTASAAASFKKALELDGKNVAAMIGMGEIALRQGLFGDAIAHLKKAARLARSARVYTLLGEAYLNSGNNGEAARNFKAALQIDPDNARARDGYNEASSRVPPEE